MFSKIKCPKCGTEGQMSLTIEVYRGPYRCWKCHELFSLHLESGEVKSIEPLSQDDMQKLEQIRTLKDRFNKG